MNRIITVSSLTIDLEKIRTIKINPVTEISVEQVLTIEYNSRIVYAKDPSSEKVEKTIVVDTITKEYSDLETAQHYQQIIEDSWNTYLNKKLNHSLKAVGEF